MSEHPLQTQTNELVNMIFEDLAKGQDRVFDALVQGAPIARLPEPHFRDYFLHGFLGNPPNEQWMAQWISVAGTPAAEVQIFDPLTGEDLYRVPPAVASAALATQGQTRARMRDIFEHTANLSQNSPTQAQHFMMQALGDKSRTVGGEQVQSYQQRWQEIFARYGYVQQQSQASQPALSAEGDDLFEY